jgi:hypothetical protein
MVVCISGPTRISMEGSTCRPFSRARVQPSVAASSSLPSSALSFPIESRKRLLSAPTRTKCKPCFGGLALWKTSRSGDHPETESHRAAERRSSRPSQLRANRKRYGFHITSVLSNASLPLTSGEQSGEQKSPSETLFTQFWCIQPDCKPLRRLNDPRNDRFAKPLYWLIPVPRVRIPPSPPYY